MSQLPRLHDKTVKFGKHKAQWSTLEQFKIGQKWGAVNIVHSGIVSLVGTNLLATYGCKDLLVTRTIKIAHQKIMILPHLLRHHIRPICPHSVWWECCHPGEFGWRMRLDQTKLPRDPLDSNFCTVDCRFTFGLAWTRNTLATSYQGSF